MLNHRDLTWSLCFSVCFTLIDVFCLAEKLPRGKIWILLSKKHPSRFAQDRFPEVCPLSSSRKPVEALRTASRGLRSKWELNRRYYVRYNERLLPKGLKMFKKRKLVISMDKQDKDGTTETSEPKHFEAKADYVIHKLEGIGGKVFLGFCIYILLDTYRQVQVANAIYQPQES